MRIVSIDPSLLYPHPLRTRLGAASISLYGCLDTTASLCANASVRVFYLTCGRSCIRPCISLFLNGCWCACTYAFSSVRTLPRISVRMDAACVHTCAFSYMDEVCVSVCMDAASIHTFALSCTDASICVCLHGRCIHPCFALSCMDAGVRVCIY